MPKIDLTNDEQTMIMEALNTEIKSAKRAQNAGKTPHIKEVYQTHERVLQTLSNKIATAK